MDFDENHCDTCDSPIDDHRCKGCESGISFRDHLDDTDCTGYCDGCAQNRMLELEAICATFAENACFHDECKVCGGFMRDDDNKIDHDDWCPVLAFRALKAGQMRRAMTCLIDGNPCEQHAGMVHGGEAEELRAGIERIIASHYLEDPGVTVALQRLLDRVDARDSLAYVERRDARIDELESTLGSISELLEHDLYDEARALLKGAK